MLPEQQRFVGGTVFCRCQLNKNNALESQKLMKHISESPTRGKKSFIEHQDAGEGYIYEACQKSKYLLLWPVIVVEIHAMLFSRPGLPVMFLSVYQEKFTKTPYCA